VAALLHQAAVRRAPAPDHRPPLPEELVADQSDRASRCFTESSSEFAAAGGVVGPTLDRASVEHSTGRSTIRRGRGRPVAAGRREGDPPFAYRVLIAVPEDRRMSLFPGALPAPRFPPAPGSALLEFAVTQGWSGPGEAVETG